MNRPTGEPQPERPVASSHEEALAFLHDKLKLTPVHALHWYHDGEKWTWEAGTCARLDHCVYWFMSGGEVLYIGKTNWLDGRMRGHYDTINTYGEQRKVEGIARVASENDELEVWAAAVPPQNIGGYFVPNEEAVETALVWHIDPPVNRQKRKSTPAISNSGS